MTNFPTAPAGWSDAHLRALGWVAAAFGALEAVLYFQVATKLGSTPERANLLLGRASWTQLVDTFSRLVEHDHYEEPSLVDEWKAWRRRGNALADRRNEALHASWMFGQPDDRLVQALRVRIGLSGMPVSFTSVGDLERLAGEIQQALLDLLDLGTKFGSTA